jgi:hypothetical protein
VKLFTKRNLSRRKKYISPSVVQYSITAIRKLCIVVEVKAELKSRFNREASTDEIIFEVEDRYNLFLSVSELLDIESMVEISLLKPNDFH